MPCNSKKSRNIIVDTDPGTDDSLALALASVFFRGHVQSVISTYGNVNGEQTHSNLVALVRMLKLDCNVFRGSSKPLSGVEPVFTSFHGGDGLCGVPIPRTAYSQIEKEGIDLLYNDIVSCKHVTYIAIGPLTNAARLLEKHPDVQSYIDELVIMGGGLSTWNFPNQTEYNFSLDGLAVQKVLAFPIKKTLCTLDLTYQLAYSNVDIENILVRSREKVFASKTPDSLLAQIFFSNYDTSRNHKQPGAMLHDASTFLYLLNPNECVVSQKRIKADGFGCIEENPNGYSVFFVETMSKDYVTAKIAETFRVLKKDL